MNEKWKSLYEALSSNPKYKLGSEQEFYDKFSNKESAEKLYGVLAQDPDFKVQESADDFTINFFFQTTKVAHKNLHPPLNLLEMVRSVWSKLHSRMGNRLNVLLNR